MMKHPPRVMCGLVVVLLMTGLTEATHSSCRQPSNQELAQYLSGGSSLPESFYQLPELLKNIQTYNRSSADYRARFSIFYDDGKTCSDKWNHDPCPVAWVFNYNSDRFPDTLLEAKCKCDSCDSISIRSACTPVYYYTKVMRKGNCNSNTGVYNYEQVWEPITVGCACRDPPYRFSANDNNRAFPSNGD